MTPDRDEGPSKTRLKREAESLQALGEELAGLPGEVLDGLDLPDRLRVALEDLSRITSHEAQRRQRQFIGKLMRDVDPEPLRALLEARKRPSREATKLFRLAEDWRDRLVQQGAAAVEAFVAAYPGVDADALDTAATAAREGRSGAPKRLFRMVKSIVDAAAAQGASPRDNALLE